MTSLFVFGSLRKISTWVPRVGVRVDVWIQVDVGNRVNLEDVQVETSHATGLSRIKRKKKRRQEEKLEKNSKRKRTAKLSLGIISSELPI